MPPSARRTQNQYMQQRSTAIESIESTISELGQIFSQLAHMVAEQRETVQRIDDNIMDVADNVSGAQRELLKYYNSVASNRWLMLKIFGVSTGRLGKRKRREQIGLTYCVCIGADRF